MSVKFQVLSFKLLLLAALPAFAADIPEYQIKTLEKAHSMFRAATNSTMYAEAAKQYEFLVQEENIHNGHLYYTLANTHFLAGNIGRAILNYRRAEKYTPRNADLRHNLDYARKQRIDLIPSKERSAMTEKLLGWHYHIPTALRWWLFAASYLLMWGAWVWVGKSRRNEARIAFAAAALLSVVLATSLVVELAAARQMKDGVILAKEVLARKGDGEIYAPSFLEPLHTGTEFRLLESRGQWWYIRLADGQSCWIPAHAAETVEL
ncbi:MAG: hypothetical protein K9M45_03155 [Kiritimatiellales bacterium]|nr:hypothetical protein [Kiritimatiellales bacterium]